MYLQATYLGTQIEACEGATPPSIPCGLPSRNEQARPGTKVKRPPHYTMKGVKDFPQISNHIRAKNRLFP